LGWGMEERSKSQSASGGCQGSTQVQAAVLQQQARFGYGRFYVRGEVLPGLYAVSHYHGALDDGTCYLYSDGYTKFEASRETLRGRLDIDIWARAADSTAEGS
jgi:hypothetical protein